MTHASKQTASTDFLGKTVNVVIDRPLGSAHPKYGWLYGLNYGFVPDTLAPDGEELDAYVIGVKQPIKNFTGRCIAVIHRTDDNDDKLIVVSNDKEALTNEDIRAAVNFQERFFTSEIIRSA